VNRPASRLPAIVEQHQKEVLADWLSNQTASGGGARRAHPGRTVTGRIAAFLGLSRKAIQQGIEFDTRSAQWAEVRDFLTSCRAAARRRVSRRRRWQRSSFP
jgi:hypothetical protein